MGFSIVLVHRMLGMGIRLLELVQRYLQLEGRIRMIYIMIYGLLILVMPWALFVC